MPLDYIIIFSLLFLSALSSIYRALYKKIKTLSKLELDKKQNQILQKDISIANLQSQVKNLNAQKEYLLSQIEILQHKCSQKENRLINAENIFKEQKLTIKNLSEQNTKQEEQIGNLEKEIKTLQKLLAETSKEAQSLFETAEILKKDNSFQEVLSFAKQGQNIFVTGGAGTGKSYILTHLVSNIPELKGNITSTTGISAININGQTIHSWAGLGRINIKYKTTKDWSEKEWDAEILKWVNIISKKIFKDEIKTANIKSCKMLAIDEISMLSDNVFTILDLSLQRIRKNYTPFGGIQMLIMGDFCQLPPIIKDNPNPKNSHFAFNSPSWKALNLTNVCLTTIHRQENKKFAAILNDLRFAEKKDKAFKYLTDRIIIANQTKDILHIFPLNREVAARNSYFLEQIPSEAITITSEDYIAEEKYVDNERTLSTLRKADEKDIIVFDKDKIEENTKAKKELYLKIGCRVMLIKNINPKAGFANGSVGTVTDIGTDYVSIEVPNRGTCTLRAETFETDFNNDPQKDNLYLIRKQIPLTLAYAITIHKSQGLTFDEATISITGNYINYGQAYVALSRVRTKQGLNILSKIPLENIKADSEVIRFYKNL